MSQVRERELEARQQEAEAADKERRAAAQRHQRDLAQEAARLQGIADQQQVSPSPSVTFRWLVSHVCAEQHAMCLCLASARLATSVSAPQQLSEHPSWQSSSQTSRRRDVLCSASAG